MSTLEIDKLVYEYTKDHGGIPATLGYDGFPKSCCTSINEVVCHGIPNEFDILEEGDIINVDCTTILDGYYADASRMFTIGKTTPQKEKLVRVAKECLEIGMEAAKPFGFVGDIGHAIEKHAKKNGFSVVRDLCGHGVGIEFHEEPDVEHFGKKEKLVRVAKECLEIGMEAAKPFGFVGDIGHAIEKHAKKNGFSVVRDLCGHGVGIEFHEEPDVEHFGKKGTGMLLVPGMVFTIEPMINMGTWEVFIDEEDGWTVVTEDEQPSAQWEHTFVMTDNGLEILAH